MQNGTQAVMYAAVNVNTVILETDKCNIIASYSISAFATC